MPPKQKKDDGDEVGDKVQILQYKVKAMETKLANEQEKCDKAKHNQVINQNKTKELYTKFMEQKKKMFNINYEMTQKYNQVDGDLQKEIQILKQKLEEREQFITQKNEQIVQIENDFSLKMRQKDDEINDLRKKIEELSNEFARMLKETLEKMQERIVLAQWDTEQDNSLKKNKDYN